MHEELRWLEIEAKSSRRIQVDRAIERSNLGQN